MHMVPLIVALVMSALAFQTVLATAQCPSGQKVCGYGCYDPEESICCGARLASGQVCGKNQVCAHNTINVCLDADSPKAPPKPHKHATPTATSDDDDEITPVKTPSRIMRTYGHWDHPPPEYTPSCVLGTVVCMDEKYNRPEVKTMTIGCHRKGICVKPYACRKVDHKYKCINWWDVWECGPRGEGCDRD